MTDAQKIELIVTTVADYYGIDWQMMWRNIRRHTSARRNMLKLIKEDGVMLDSNTISDMTHINRHTVWNNLVLPDDKDLPILRELVNRHFTLKQAS